MLKQTKINWKILPTLLLTGILLSGCLSLDGGNSGGGNNNSNQALQQSKSYNNGQFEISYPENWDVIEPKNFTSDIPPETKVVIRNNIKNENFTANVNIVQNSLQKDKSSLDYAKEVLNRQKTGLLDYKETKRDLVKINIGGSEQESYYVEFDARLNPGDPITRFAQTYGVKGSNAYIALAAHAQEESTAVIDQLHKMIKSFQVK